jgi:hypothetical protein
MWILFCIVVPDAYVEYLKKELNEVEVESANVATEIEHLAKTRKDG